MAFINLITTNYDELLKLIILVLINENELIIITKLKRK